MTNLNGKEVLEFQHQSLEWNSEGYKVLESTFRKQFIYCVETNKEHFILEHNSFGEEIARWNVRNVSWFRWKKEISNESKTQKCREI